MKQPKPSKYDGWVIVIATILFSVVGAIAMAYVMR